MGQPNRSVHDVVSSDVVSSDAELVAHAREGDTEAFAELVARHAPSAVRLASRVAPDADRDALVGEASDHLLVVLRAGGGPDIAVRPFLLGVVRRTSSQDDDPAPFEPGAMFTGPAGRAFASLPERWQLALWHFDVEGETAAEVAPLLGVPADSIPGLADQARDGLRAALPEPAESDPRDLLGPVVLGAASAAYLGTPLVTDTADPTTVRRRVVAARVAALVAVAAVGSVVAIVFGSQLSPSRHGGAPATGGRATDAAPSAAPAEKTRRDIVAAVLSATGAPTSAPAGGRAADTRGPFGGRAASAGVRRRAAGASRPFGGRAASASGPFGGRAASASERRRDPGGASGSPTPAGRTADVAVGARSSSMLPRSYDVQSTQRGVPAGRTATLVVRGTSGTVLMSRGMSCTGDGSSRLHCTVGRDRKSTRLNSSH